MINRKIHIVVIDDERAIDMLFKAFFDTEISAGQIKISYVELAKKCFSIMETEVVDLVLSDINMPEMNGFDFLDIMKEKWPNIPVYMISAYGGQDYIDKALEKGAVEFFVKPFDFEEIRAKVQVLITG